MLKTLFSLIAIPLAFAACTPNAAINTANAQTPDYEFTVIVPLDEFAVKKTAKSDTVIAQHTIMYAAPNAQTYNVAPFYKALKNRKNLNWFADKNCTQPIKMDFKRCDTLLKNGKFFEATCSEGINDNEVVAYALRHIVKYNPTTQKMSAEVVALAPIFTRYNTKGQKYQQCLGWLKLPISDKNNTANTNEINDFAFAKRTTLYIKNSDTKQPSTITTPLSQTLFAAAQQKKLKTYQPYSPYALISEKEFAAMQVERIDTVVTFNPESYEESMKIVKSEGIKIADISGLVYHLLYNFDEKTFKFTTKIESVGLEEEHKDDKGKFMYKNTAFCVKPE